MLSDYWSWDEEELEACHDFIQWMFPLDEPSAFNADAPLVTPDDQKAFRREMQLQIAYRRSIAKFLEFLGLQIGADGLVNRGPNFDRRLAVWRGLNHNWLRITRMLKSMRLLGFENEAAAVWRCLRMLHDDCGFVSETSFAYWQGAASGLK
jgi:hypothetical protein